MKRLPPFLSWILLGLAAAIAGIAYTQPWNALAAPSEIVMMATTTSDFTYQGRLTNSLGQPIANGVYTMTFRLYDDAAAPVGSPLATSVATPTVSGGLFVVNLSGFAGFVDGRDLYIGVAVGGDPELSPRQRIAPVPYALSLRPGAVITDSRTTGFLCIIGTLCPPTAIVRVENSAVDPPVILSIAGAGLTGIGNEGVGLWGGSKGDSGVVGKTLSTITGTAGVVGIGPISGTAIYAGGNGRIQSAAESKWWISGQSVVKNLNTDTTRWDMESPGNVRLYSGNAAGATPIVYIPVSVPAQLYGQDTTVESVRIYYRRTGTAFITSTTIRRLDTTTGGSVAMASSTTDQTSNTFAGYTLDTPTDNVLTAGNGGMAIYLQLDFANNVDAVLIYGVELTLKHR